MKQNKIVVLIILMFMVSTILSSCSKPPDGINRDLWQDSVKVVKIIKDAFEKDNNLSVKDEEFVDRYFKIYKGRLYDNKDENILINNIQKLYKNYKTYLFSKKTFSDEDFVNEDKQKVLNLFVKIENLIN